MDDNIIFALADEGNLQLPDPYLAMYYDNLKKRTIWLEEEINNDTLEVVKLITKWNEEDVGLPVTMRQPIKIMFNSPGGSLDIQDAICSIIKISKTPIYGYAIGMVASAASMIYMSCHKRFALSTAYFILHKGSISNISGNYNEIMSMIEDYQEQVERMVKSIIENTKYDQKEVEENINTDWYVHIDEALQKGIVDELITDIDLLY